MKMASITLKHFMQSLSTLTNLQWLDLSWCDITAETLPLVTAVLPSLPSLKGLNLEGNKIANEGAELLAQVLSRGHIEELSLSYCDITSLGGQCLADALTPQEGEAPPALKSLDLWMCKIGETVFTALLGTLPHNKIEHLFLGGLRTLNLSHQQAETVTQHLSKATHLKELDLSGTHLGPETQKALFNALAHNASLEKLRLIECGISPEGVQALSRALRTNSSLKELVLNYNIFGSEAGRVLFKALLHNNGLEQLEISYCCRDDESDETRNEYRDFVKKTVGEINAQRQAANLPLLSLQ